MSLMNTIFVSLLSVLLIFSATVVAEEAKALESQMQQSSRVIIIRGLETPKTRSTNFNVYLGKQSIGRMKVDTVRELVVAPGSYELRSNFQGDKPMMVDLLPGKTYYVKAAMVKKPGTYNSVYKLISEDYAYELIPSLSEETARSI